MNAQSLKVLSALAAGLLSGAATADATVNAAGVASIDAASTPGTILESAGTVDLALNFGATSGATINGIAFTGAPLTVGTPVVGAGATLTPNAPTPAGTTLRNLDLNGYLWTTGTPLAGVMNDMVDSQRWPAVAGDALNFTITGLDANRFYFVQLLSGDTRAEFENQNYTLGGVVQNGQFGNGGANDGVLVKYTVTGETALNLSVSNVTGASPPLLSGILIRSVEPGLFAPATASGTSDGTPSTLTVQLLNAASTAYNITGASFSGTNAGEFSNGSTLPLNVPATGTADYTVNVTPSAGGTRTAMLTLTTDDPSTPTLAVALSVDVFDPVAYIDPSQDFGATAALPGPTPDGVYVDNTGGATNLTFSSPVITGPGAAAFTVTSLPAPIAPGNSDFVEVTFNPPAPGYYAATLQLTTNDPFTPTVSVALKGEVTGNLISPVTVSAVSSENIFGLDRDANRTADGSGLTGLGSAGSTHTTGENALVWTTNGNIAAPNDLDPQITYDLGATYAVTKIREWGYNDPTVNTLLGTQARIIGPNEVEIFTSSDNVVYTSAGTVNFALAPGTAGYAGSEIPVTLPAARYIRFDIKTNHAGAIFDGTGANPGTVDNRSLTGLSEVRFEGTPSTGTPYENWLLGTTLTGNDALPDADPDKDGIPNGIEFVIGNDPEAAVIENLPTATVIGTDLVFVFRRTGESASYNPVAQVSTSLHAGSWTNVATGIAVDVDHYGPGIDRVTVTIQRGANAAMFARLAVSIP